MTSDTSDLSLVETIGEAIGQDLTEARDAIDEPPAAAVWQKRPEPITVRATVNLTGLRAGDRVRVDPTDPYTAGLIQRGFLVED